MTPTPAELAKELLALAEKATPGPWTADAWERIIKDSIGTAQGSIDAVLVLRGGQVELDAAYIAACSPDRITVLCKAISQQAKQIEMLGEEIDNLESDADDAAKEIAILKAPAPASDTKAPSPDDAEEVDMVTAIEGFCNELRKRSPSHAEAIYFWRESLTALLRSRGAGRTPVGTVVVCRKCVRMKNGVRAPGSFGVVPWADCKDADCPLRKEERT